MPSSCVSIAVCLRSAVRRDRDPVRRAAAAFRFRSRVVHEAGDVLLEMAGMSQPNNREPALQILRALSGQDYGADVQAWRRWIDESR
jgi:hypothetical protein